MPGTTAFARHSLVSIALRIVLPLCFFEEHCIVNCEARPPHSKVQPPQNPSTATFRNRENQNGPLGTAMILMGPTGVNIGQYRSISVNIGQYRSISVNSGRSMFLNEFRQTSVNFGQFRGILADSCFCVIHIQAGAAHHRPWINMPAPFALGNRSGAAVCESSEGHDANFPPCVL